MNLSDITADEMHDMRKFCRTVAYKHLRKYIGSSRYDYVTTSRFDDLMSEVWEDLLTYDGDEDRMDVAARSVRKHINRQAAYNVDPRLRMKGIYRDRYVPFFVVNEEGEVDEREDLPHRGLVFDEPNEELSSERIAEVLGLDKLTPKEAKVLPFLAGRLTYKEIAEELGVTWGAPYVAQVVAQVRKKLGAADARHPYFGATKREGQHAQA